MSRHRKPRHTHVLAVTLSELGRKDARFETLEEALDALRARYPHVTVSNFSKVKHSETLYGEAVSYRMAKWSYLASPRTPGGWRTKYDGKIVQYFSSHEDPEERSEYKRRVFG